MYLLLRRPGRTGPLKASWCPPPPERCGMECVITIYGKTGSAWIWTKSPRCACRLPHNPYALPRCFSFLTRAAFLSPSPPLSPLPPSPDSRSASALSLVLGKPPIRLSHFSFPKPSWTANLTHHGCVWHQASQRGRPRRPRYVELRTQVLRPPVADMFGMIDDSGAKEVAHGPLTGGPLPQSPQ